MHRAASLCLLTTAVLACIAPGTLPAHLADGAAALPDPAVCKDPTELTERLVVDWSPLDRSKLEARARKGLVLVRVNGCDARMVEYCVAHRRYAYAPTSRQRELMIMRGRDEVRAKLPVGAARFGASLERSSELRVMMTVVGRYEAPFEQVSVSDLEGECEGATHVVASVAVGAFEIASKSAADLAAEADLMAGGVHAESTAERQRLDSAGVEARCADSKRSDADPPSDCSIPLRVELRRLGTTATRPPPPRETLATAPETQADEGMRRAVAMTRAEVAPCYRQAAALDPTLDGSISLVATVGQDGHVTKVMARHDVTQALADCAMSRATRVVFPATDKTEPRLFVLPLVFKGARAAAR
jgi:hypothetical protein